MGAHRKFSTGWGWAKPMPYKSEATSAPREGDKDKGMGRPTIEGLGSIVSSPSGVRGGSSPSRKRVLMHFELERNHVVTTTLVFLQDVSIACYAEPCISHRRHAVRLSPKGNVSKRRKQGPQNLHRPKDQLLFSQD